MFITKFIILRNVFNLIVDNVFQIGLEVAVSNIHSQ